MAGKVKKDFDTEIIKDHMMLRGFTFVDNAEWHSLVYDASPSCFIVYFALLSHRNHETGECTPSIELLGRDCNLSENTVLNAIDKLEEAGYLKINSGSDGRYSHYYMPKSLDTYGKPFKPAQVDCIKPYEEAMKNAVRKKSKKE